jgi:type IV pilus assembly protein PilA
MKSFRYLFLVTTLCFLGCGKNASQTPASTAPPAAQQTPQPGQTNPPDDLDKKLAKAEKIAHKVDDGLKRAQALKAAVEAAVGHDRGIPPSFADVRSRNLPPSDSDAASIDLADSGSIVIAYAPDADFPGGTIELKPVVSNGAVTSWDCTGGTLAAQYRPDTCG